MPTSFALLLVAALMSSASHASGQRGCGVAIAPAKRVSLYEIGDAVLEHLLRPLTAGRLGTTASLRGDWTSSASRIGFRTEYQGIQRLIAVVKVVPDRSRRTLHLQFLSHVEEGDPAQAKIIPMLQAWIVSRVPMQFERVALSIDTTQTAEVAPVALLLANRGALPTSEDRETYRTNAKFRSRANTWAVQRITDTPPEKVIFLRQQLITMLPLLTFWRRMEDPVPFAHLGRVVLHGVRRSTTGNFTYEVHLQRTPTRIAEVEVQLESPQREPKRFRLRADGSRFEIPPL